MKNIVSSIIHYLTLKLKYLKKNIALLGNYIIWSIWKKKPKQFFKACQSWTGHQKLLG